MSATSATCAQRTGASSPAEPATTCGRPWRSTGRASTSATVGYMAPRGLIGRDRLYGRDPTDVHVVDGVGVAPARRLWGKSPSEGARAVTDRISHWIDGKPFDGTAERSGE